MTPVPRVAPGASLAVRAARLIIVGLCRVLLSLRSRDLPAQGGRPRIYAANHASHADFVAIWTALPRELRARTRPVAGGDYWRKTALRRWLIDNVFNGVLVERGAARPEGGESPAIPILIAPLQAGEDLILFPEGTRNLTDATLLPLRSGIFQILERVPEAEVVPAWISHMDRILPKGAIVPVPLDCRLSFGPALQLRPGESKSEFLDRLHAAILECKAGPA